MLHLTSSPAFSLFCFLLLSPLSSSHFLSSPLLLPVTMQHVSTLLHGYQLFLTLCGSGGPCHYLSGICRCPQTHTRIIGSCCNPYSWLCAGWHFGAIRDRFLACVTELERVTFCVCGGGGSLGSGTSGALDLLLCVVVMVPGFQDVAPKWHPIPCIVHHLWALVVSSPL